MKVNMRGFFLVSENKDEEFDIICAVHERRGKKRVPEDQQALYIGACSDVFILLLNTKLISFGIGSVSTVNIISQPELQIAIGVLCGLVESKIGVNIYNRAVTLIESSGS